MPVELRVIGANQLGDIAARLKDAGDKDLRRDLLRGINRATKPAKEKVKAAALRDLPQHGGLNQFVASARFGSRTRMSRNPSVSLTGKKSGHDLQAIDQGRVRHPVFGNKKAWVVQPVKPGWWSETLAGEVPEIRREVIHTLDDVARRLARG